MYAFDDLVSHPLKRRRTTYVRHGARKRTSANNMKIRAAINCFTGPPDFANPDRIGAVANLESI